jgi:molecular chaperone DnaK (HSP70)
MSFGIDFGTSNSVVARWNGRTAEVVPIDSDSLPALWRQPEFEQIFPSVLAVRDLQRTLCFGWEAKTGASEPLDAVKRMLGTRSGAEQDGGLDDEDVLPHLEEHHVWVGGEAFPSTAAAAALFSRMRDSTASHLLDLTEAVVTVPANATGGARFRTRAAASLGGIKVKALLNEPTAAAISYAYDYPVPGRFLVFDWGGGTIDVTVLTYEDGLFEEETSRGISALGGLEFDEVLAKLILRRLGRTPEGLSRAERRQWRRYVELTKISLSHVPAGGRVLFEPPATERSGRDQGPVAISEAEYRSAISPLIGHAMKPVEQALKDLGIVPDDIDTVLLIGGTSQIPQVRTELGAVFGHERIIDPRLCRPMTAVARGAAIYAAALNGELHDADDFSLVTSYDLGTAVSAGQQRGFRPIIRRNATLPAEGTSTFQPSAPGATSVRVEIIEGESGHAADSDRSFPLATIDVPLPTAERDPSHNRIEIRFRYNESGILRFTARHAVTGATLSEREIDSFGPDGTPLQEGVEDGLTRLLAHTVRPFPLPTASPAGDLVPTVQQQTAPAASARPAPSAIRDPDISVNGEAMPLAQ